MRNYKFIFCIMGPSGSGKDTIKDRLLKKDDNLTLVKSITTRPKREFDNNKDDYIYVDDETFNVYIKSNYIMEHTKFNVVTEKCKNQIWKYGHCFPEGRYNLMVGSLETFNNLKKFKNNFNIIGIVLELDERIRFSRMMQRELTLKNKNFPELYRRFNSEVHKYSQYNFNKLGITNDKYYDNSKILNRIIKFFTSTFVKKKDNLTYMDYHFINNNTNDINSSVNRIYQIILDYIKE